MLTVKKITDKSLNLDIQGQGCWDDCFIAGHWENRSSTSTAGCNWIGDHNSPHNNPFA